MSMSMFSPLQREGQVMSVSVAGPKVVAGETLILEIRANDPTGIKRVTVECYHFSLWNSTRCKTALGEYTAAGTPENHGRYRVAIPIPEDAATGQWGIKTVRFVNGRNYVATFYRGQGRFDSVVFDVVNRRPEPENFLRFEGVDVVSDPQD